MDRISDILVQILLLPSLSILPFSDYEDVPPGVAYTHAKRGTNTSPSSPNTPNTGGLIPSLGPALLLSHSPPGTS